jgi:hypothetical protein
MAFSYSPKIITEGLVLYLDAANPYSYVSGSLNWNDLSRSQLSGSLINGPTYNSANNGSIVFDGVDDYVNLGNTSTVNITNNFTFNVFFLTPNILQSGQTLFSKAEGGAYGLEFNTSLISSGLGFIAYIGGQYRIVTESIDNYTSNTYYCVTITYNNSNLILYRNGVLRSTTSISGDISTTTQPLCLGINPQASGPYILPFVGRIPLFQIYNRALTATEIFQNYNATKTRFGLT